MSNHSKIQQLRDQLDGELNKPQPDEVKIQKLRQKIMLVGLGLTGRDTIKPF